MHTLQLKIDDSIFDKFMRLLDTLPKEKILVSMLEISPKHKSRFKHHCSSPEYIMLVVYIKCRFSLSYREIEELLEIRGGKVDGSVSSKYLSSRSCVG